jgi:aminoglycoside phosphotransferase (APT) family kinase protein
MILRMRPLPHGYTHDTRTDGSTVEKRYQGPYADVRRSTERLVLSRLARGVVPLPRLLGEPAGALRMQHVAGVHGQDLIDAGHAAAVLRSCGQTLRQLQSAEAADVFDDVPVEPSAVLVHGDYGPNNMLFDPVTFATAAVLDWEWAHAGGPVEDLAWCEWIVRMHHPAAVDDLAHLFDGYGGRPDWSARQAAMMAKCRSMLALFRPAGTGSSGADRWRRFLEITGSWTE